MEILASDLPSPFGCSPLRRKNSFRRTTTMDVLWPEGRYGKLELIGNGRDIFTADTALPPVVLDKARLNAIITDDKKIDAISSDPRCSALSSLRGMSAVGGFRKAFRPLLDKDKLASPLELLLDDVVGGTVVSDWAWSTRPNSITRNEKLERQARLNDMAGVCTGFRVGSSALHADGEFQYERCTVVPALLHPDDAVGWHELLQFDEVNLRRSRCMDVWLDRVIVVEAVFQDSALQLDGRRVAVHEYSLRAEVNPKSFTLQELLITPHVLPYPECPSAVSFTHSLIGMALPELKASVHSLLGRERGCTHLNDMLRSLSDLPEIICSLSSQFES